MSQSDSDFDVKIIVGNEPNIKKFGAHSTVLRYCSLYFERALSERWKDQKHGIYIIKKPNIHPTIFKLILDYIYTGKNICKGSGEVSLNILIASDELELLDLAEDAQNHLIDMFSPWLFSNIVANPYSLFDSADYRLLDEAALICLLECDELELDEIEIWNYLIKWGISKLFDENITNWSDKNTIGWIKIKKRDKAILNDESYGPCFGESDLCMRFSNRWTSNWKNYEHEITSSNLLIAEEYEVWTLDNYNPMMNIILKTFRISLFIIIDQQKYNISNFYFLTLILNNGFPTFTSLT
ncbi:14392_t:CDS:2 [Cetraspora pellucida]|uniref:14392_t:CDS:1 n=1 Tax=Cetraspora pellucida TaxID=1433469 RepID=A0ACA9K346_9GLOM|nr:14392_t:CDS:2 [Cetraspora pellucida]